MMKLMRSGPCRRAFLALKHFLSFFLLMSFVITCSMCLFLNTMSMVTGRSLLEGEIKLAAQVTFANVVLLSFLCAVIDAVRRRIMVGRPVEKIAHAAERIVQGDLSVRIPKSPSMDPDDGFNLVIDYFNRMAEELSGVEILRSDFIANVSHEMKTPLSVIENYGTLLRQPNLPEEKRQEYAKVITEASRDMAGMVSNVLRLNKLENQTIYPAPRRFDLREQLCGCLLVFEEQWESKNLELETELAENVLVCADPELLALVWSNLFSNAIKFTEPGGKVSLVLKAEGDEAVVQVSDTGCGFDREVGKHIFEKFYQGDPSHAVKGNGLGLALVRRVMDIIGGEIAVSSEVGKGSAFTVRLRREVDGTA